MNIIISLITYSFIFYIYLFSLGCMFAPDGSLPGSSLSPASWAKMSIRSFAAAIFQTAMEYYFYQYYSYHVMAVSLLILYLILGIAFFYRHINFCIYYALLMSVFMPYVTFLSANIMKLLSIPENLIYIATRQGIVVGILGITWWWIIRISRNFSFSFPLPAGYWFIMYFSVLLEYYCLIQLNDLLTYNNLVTGFTAILQTMLLFIYLLLYWLILNMCRNYHVTLKNQAVSQYLTLSGNAFEENHQLYEQMRTLRHELKNHMFYMDYLLDQKRYQELHQYFMEFYQKEYESSGYWESSSSAINTLLNRKQLVAKEKGIPIEIDNALPVQLPANEAAICTILSNLLDNAIESCEKQSDKSSRIHVNLSIRQKFLSIIVSNTVTQNVLKENPLLHTTKSENQLHGIGLKVIKKLTDQYQGMMDITVEDHIFKVKILFPLLQEAANVEDSSM